MSLSVLGARSPQIRPDTRSLVDDLTAMSQWSLNKLVQDLGPMILPYEPQEESRCEFAKSLVDYFSETNSLSVLREAYERVAGVLESTEFPPVSCP